MRTVMTHDNDEDGHDDDEDGYDDSIQDVGP